MADITVDGTLLITLFGLRSFSLSRFDNPGTGQRRHPLPISPLADDTSLTSADVVSLSGQQTVGNTVLELDINAG